MFIKNVSKEAIVNYNCGYGNFVSVKAGEVVEVVDPRAVKQFLRLLPTSVEVTTKPKPKKVEKVIEKEAKPIIKVLKKIIKK